MLAVILLFSPVIALTIWLISISWKSRDWATIVCIPLLITTIIYPLGALYIQWYNPGHLDKLTHWMFDFIAIVLYVYLCTRCNRRWVVTTTFVLLAMPLINMFSGLTLYMGDEWGTPAPNDDALYIYINGESVFRIKLWQICIAVQFSWIGGRFYFFNKKMRTSHLHFSQKSKTITKAVGYTMLLTIFYLFTPKKLWFSSPILLYLLVISVSAGLSVMIYMLAKGYALTPILDINEEPAVFTANDSSKDIWEKIRHAVEDDKLFLSPDIHVAQVARLAGTNRAYLTTAISRYAETNFNGYINGLRTEYATELMVNNAKMKLEEVAEICGFGSASTFTKVYKKITGMTPSEGKKKRMIEIAERLKAKGKVRKAKGERQKTKDEGPKAKDEGEKAKD